MPLSDLKVRSSKPRGTGYKLTDGEGMYLLVSPSGAKAWRFDYRFFNKRKTLSLGLYPAVGLKDARAKREEARRLLAQDIDPSVQKKQARLAARFANANTFGSIGGEYLEKMEADGRAEPTLVKNRWMIEELASSLARRPISEISSADVLAVLRSIEKSGRVESALATRAAIGRVFRYAIATARAQNDPTFALRGALTRHSPASHPAISTVDELGGLARAIWGYEGWPTLAGALKIQALCFARPSETRTMEWDEVDTKRAIWVIPAVKAKMRRPHSVPLSTQAIVVINEMIAFRGNQPFVFRSMMSGKAVLSENSMNSALRRMGFTHEQHTAHGFRSTASTILNESGLFSSDAIEAQLAHQDSNATRRVYNRAQYWDERVRMMQWWADLIEEQRRTSMSGQFAD